MQIVVALAFITLVSQCTNNSVLFALEELTQPPLSWEENHPERAAWSKELKKQVVIHFDDLSSAKDMPYFCPTFHYLNNSQKILALSEMMVWTAYYESSWNPNSASVDVGTKDDKDTWSVGLWQMSVVDQDNYKIYLDYNYRDLKNPIKNARLALPILAKLIREHGYIMQKPGGGSYWSTLRKNRKAPLIATHVRDLEICK